MKMPMSLQLRMHLTDFWVEQEAFVSFVRQEARRYIITFLITIYQEMMPALSMAPICGLCLILLATAGDRLKESTMILHVR